MELTLSRETLCFERLALSQREQVSVEGDYSRLMQVVYNLVNNAVNYAGEDKKILVTQTVEQGKVTISVKDHGEGIPEEQLPLIWERYYKVDKTHKRATVGSGLGLSIVQDTVKKRGGMVSAANRPNGGAGFTVRWPEAEGGDHS